MKSKEEIEFNERERAMIYAITKSQRHLDEDYYKLYEKVSEWYFNA